MTYDEWEAMVPEEIKGDSLWKMEAYRIALFLGDLGWYDETKLAGDRRTRGLAEQLYEALGGISGTLSEGYSRGTGKDRARFYEYALGSARESRDWYFKGRHVLGQVVFLHRLRLLTQIIRLLLSTVSQQRGRVLREPDPVYEIGTEDAAQALPANEVDLQDLLQNVPLPSSYHA